MATRTSRKTQTRAGARKDSGKRTGAKRSFSRTPRRNLSEPGTIGVIGGVGLYEMDGLSGIERVRLSTPFGEPSGEFILGRMEDKRMAFLSRHGKGHRISPPELNFRANIYGFKLLGVERLFSVSAVGSMKEEIIPGDIVLPDQFFDRTAGRPRSFFTGGIVAHVSMADPVCPELVGIFSRAGDEMGVRFHRGGTYICIEGPQFSTRAESEVYRSWGVSVIGMTNLPEARLAREAEICYATIAIVTDYDCWNPKAGSVEIEEVFRVINTSMEKAKEIIRRAVLAVPAVRTCECSRAMQYAIVTDPAVQPKKLLQTLKILIPSRKKS